MWREILASLSINFMDVFVGDNKIDSLKSTRRFQPIKKCLHRCVPYTHYFAHLNIYFCGLLVFPQTV